MCFIDRKNRIELTYAHIGRRKNIIKVKMAAQTDFKLVDCRCYTIPWNVRRIYILKQ